MVWIIVGLLFAVVYFLLDISEKLDERNDS